MKIFFISVNIEYFVLSSFNVSSSKGIYKFINFTFCSEQTQAFVTSYILPTVDRSEHEFIKV